MLKSMTAYGRSVTLSSIGRLSVELHSVNRKHLEINTFLPKELLRFDSLIKSLLAAKVARGSVHVKVNVVFENESPLKVKPNLALAKELKNAWDEIARELGHPAGTVFDLTLLMKEPGLLIYDEELKNEEEYAQALRSGLQEALEHLIEMKVTEGIALERDIQERLRLLKKALEEIKQRTTGASDRLKQKLIAKLEEVSISILEHEERLLREVLLYAEKADVTEEITRFESHLTQFQGLLGSQKEGIGKTLEFMIQELNREINTIGSKASDVEVTRSVVEVKSELEKIREQIQNVE